VTGSSVFPYGLKQRSDYVSMIIKHVYMYIADVALIKLCAGGLEEQRQTRLICDPPTSLLLLCPSMYNGTAGSYTYHI
jgi:hypothetical protein